VLRVNVHLPAGEHSLYAAIGPSRKAKFDFPGVWNETPGKYYWQAQYTAPLCQAPHCEVLSAMHSFRVVK